MLIIESPADARTAIMDFMMDHGSDIPADMRKQIRELSSSPSPVDQIVRTGEFLYARKDEVGPEGRTLAGGLCSYASLNGWHGMNENDRGGKIQQAMARENGEEPVYGRPWPEPDQDPEPKPEFVRVVEEPTPEPNPTEPNPAPVTPPDADTPTSPAPNTGE